MGLYVTHVEAREEVKTKKHTFLKVCFFSWFVHMGLYVTHAGGKGGGKNEKTHVFESVFFFVVCPYGPLCHPCGRQGRR